MSRCASVGLWGCFSLAVGVGLLGCRADHPKEAVPNPSHEPPSVERRTSGVFINGDMEADSIGVAPTGWTVTVRQNRGITDTRPSAQTFASLNLTSGGYAATQVVGGATPESVADPNLGNTATFRYPRYGTRAAVVNYLNATSKGHQYNANVMEQTMTTTNADVDASDNKVHVRFAIAPVLESGGHPYAEQPYYFVSLQNLTKGTTMYQDFNASAQDGVPWKTVGSIYYTDWQLVDIAPGNAGLAVGDQVKLTVVAAGCSQSGHFGRAYVDGIGSTVPGLYTSATGPTSVNAGSDITYVVNYRNGGTGAASGSSLAFVVPTNTTYRSNSLPSSCTGPAVGSTGTVTCTLGTLSPGASGSFTITVRVNSGTAAGSTITAGNYSISATSVSALLGPKVLTGVTSNVTYADVSITNSDGVAAVGWGQAVTYSMVVSNAGPGAASTVTVADTFPAQLSGVTWTCAGTGGGTCTASGSGDINTTANLPVGASVTYTVAANVIAGTGTGSIINVATATVSGTSSDPDTSSNTAVDTDSIGVLRTLSLTKTNGNGGTVTSVPAAIACGTSCNAATGSFVDGTQVVLTASPLSGASFTGWGGACASAGSTPTCALTLSADTAVSAAFTQPPTVNIVTGNNQGAALSTAFGTPLSVQVLDANGAAVSGATVIFSVPSSGASASLSAGSAATNASGVATVNATAGATGGAFTITAGLSGTPITATFSLWNYGTAASVTVVSGNNQSVAAGAAFPAALVVVVRDASSQPIPGAAVTFTPPGSGASATITGSPATTGSNGQASVTATATATSGAYVVTASTPGATSASFSLTNSAGAPTQLTVSGGGTQSATVGTAFASPLQVTVRDMNNLPVPGATVTFAAPSSGTSATLSASTATTNASGQASVTATANTAAGSYAVTASVSGVTTPALFSLTNTAGAAAAIAVVSGGGQTTIAGTSFGAPLLVIVTDSNGNPVAGATVTFGAPASGASSMLSATTATTNASGQASVTATANGTAGAYSVTAGLGGGSSVSLMLTNTPALAINPSATSVPPSGTVSFSASGGTGTGYVFSIVSAPSGGTVDASSGAYRAGATPNVSDTVKVTDSAGGTATATVTVGAGVTLTPPAPMVAPKGAVAFTASGGSGTGYTYAITTNLSSGTIDGAGAYRAGAVGSVSDVVTVHDSLGNTATATVQVGPTLTLSGGTAISPPRGTKTFSTSGGSGSGVTYALTTNASVGSINATTGAYVAGATPLVTDVVTATDSLGNTATFSVQVGPGVALTPASPAVAPLAAVHFVASGGSGTGFVYSLVTNASMGTLNASTGNYLAGSVGSAVDIVKATDSLGNFATVSVAVGAGLSLTPTTPMVAPGQTVGFQAHGGSSTGYRYALAPNNSGGTIDAMTGAYVAGSTANVTDTVSVTDSLGNQGSTTVQVGPGIAISPTPLTLAPKGSQTFTVSGGSGSGYVFTLSTNASGGSVDPATGAYVAGSVGGVTDVVRVVDSLGQAATASITVTAALIARPSFYITVPRAAVMLAVSGGAGETRFSLVANGSGATVDTATGAYVAGPTGDTTDTVLARDRNGVTTSVLVFVGPGVSLNPPTASLAPLDTVTFTALGGSGSGYTFELTATNSGGSIDSETGVYFAGPVSDVTDEITATDSLGNTATAHVIVGNGLVIEPAAPHVATRETVMFTVSGGSGTGYAWALSSNQSNGTIDAQDGSYRAGTVAGVEDEVTVTDSLGNTATVTVVVGEALAIAPTEATLAPMGTLQFSARGGSGNGVRFSITTNASGGEIDPETGAYTAGAKPSVTDQITVSDDLGNQAVAVVHVGAGLVIDPPSTTVAPRTMITFRATGGGGGYTFALRQNGSGATIVSTSGAYTAGPRAGAHDLIEVTDGLGNVASASVTVGTGLSLTPPAPHVTGGGTTTFATSGGSGTGYTYTLTMNGSGGTIDPVTGVYTAGSTDAVDTVTVVDSAGNRASVNVSVGNALALNPGAATVAPGEPLLFVATGGSGSGYTFALSSNTSGATIGGQTGTYVAGKKANVTDTVTVTDSAGNEASASVKVGPGLTITPALSMVAPATKIRFLVSGGSGVRNTFAVSTNASTATVDADLGDYRAGTKGNVIDIVTVTDSLGLTAAATVTIGDALQVSPATATVPPLGPLDLVTMGGARPYTFTLSTANSGGSVNHSSGQYRAGRTGSVSDVVSVKDANGITTTVQITVGPAVTVTPGMTTVGSRTKVALQASGGSGMGYTWTLSKNRSGGTIDATTGAYTAGTVEGGTVTDTVEVTDSLGNVGSATVQVVRAKNVTIGGGSGCDCSTSSATGGAGVSTVALLALAIALTRTRRRRS